MARPAVALIDQQAFEQNIAYLSGLANSAETILVVKADAYGHGVKNLISSFKGRRLAVACAEEAATIFSLGFEGEILLLEGPFEADCIESLAQHNVSYVIHRPEQVSMLVAQNFDGKVWLKVDSGMHRLGLTVEQTKRCIELLDGANIQLEMLMTHFSSADDRRSRSLQEQADAFDRLVSELKLDDLPVSMCNSAALMLHERYHGSAVRPGIALYGANPAPVIKPLSEKLSPVMTLQTEVIAVRDIDVGETVGYGDTWTALRPSKIATLAIGYGDGYPRHAPTGTPVLINQQLAPLVGRVSMDMITVDVTDIASVDVGAKVELWGQNLPIEEVAEHVGTISYELCTSLTSRVPRRLV